MFLFVRKETIRCDFIQIMLITSNLVCKLHLSVAIEPPVAAPASGAMAARRRDRR
jgi:hypothetical protein